MLSYLLVIKEAVYLFPFIALFFSIPYILYNYHKYGSFFSIRVGIIYSFILYLMCAYFLVILPLPSLSYVSSLTTPSFQLIPFNAIADIISNTSIIITNPSTYLSALNNSVVYQVLFNIIITIPFGMYLRYYFKCSFIKTLLFTFLLTLFFELTQLSGLYGIYPRSYRLFDVDDLITNTLGGVIGYFIIYPISMLLPSREEIDKTAYQRGINLSLPRRIMAILIDLFFITLLSIMIMMWAYLLNINISYYIFDVVFLIYFIMSNLFMKASFGKSFLNIKLISFENNKVKWYQYFIRYITLYFIIIFIPRVSLAYLYQEYITKVIGMNVFTVIQGLIISIYIIIYSYIVFGMFKKKRLLYEKLSKTKNISTISDKIEVVEYSVKENCMLDKSLPYYDIIMKANMDVASNLINTSLPEGYTYKAYEIGDEQYWAALEFEVNEFESIEKAMEYFNRVFKPYAELLTQRMFFILDENKNYVATSSAWFKDDTKRHYALLHWVSVSPSQQGKGLGNNIVKYTLSKFKDVEKNENEIFLHTQTWSYKAISLYYKCGFFISETPSADGVSDMRCIDVLKSVIDPELVDKFIEK